LTHTLLDLRGAIPAFIDISDGKLHDVNVLDILPVEARAFYVMDRAYVDFERLYAMHQAAAFFVTRANAGIDARRVYSAPTDRTDGVICNQRILVNGYFSTKNYPEHLRRIRFKDPESGKPLVFLTNNTTLPAPDRGALRRNPRGLARGQPLHQHGSAPGGVQGATRESSLDLRPDRQFAQLDVHNHTRPRKTLDWRRLAEALNEVLRSANRNRFATKG
jgi:hypothetical protein